LQMKSVIDKAT